MSQNYSNNAKSMPSSDMVSDVYAAAKSGMDSFRFLARVSLRRNWAKMSGASRRDAVAALCYMCRVSNNIPGHFSREHTYDKWIARADEFIETNNILPPMKYTAYYIVQSPKDVVVNDSAAAFCNNSELRREYYNFCSMIQDWEYDRTSGMRIILQNAYKYADRIKQDSDNLKWLVGVEKSNPFIRPFKKLFGRGGR